jgi:protein-S-isoprenylcysteine O-methyltransferase Ste14
VIHAIHDLFANRTLRTVLAQTRYLLAAALLVPLAFFTQPQWLLPGLAVSLIGQLIQTWCFAALVKNAELTIRGPYVLSRNPMYLGRYLLVLGFVLLLGSWIAVGVYTLVYCLYMVNRVEREETRLRRLFAERYAQYCSEVNRFVPSFDRITDPAVRFFDWSIFRENNAHWNIVLTLGAFAAIYGLRLALFSP